MSTLSPPWRAVDHNAGNLERLLLVGNVRKPKIQYVHRGLGGQGVLLLLMFFLFVIRVASASQRKEKKKET